MWEGISTAQVIDSFRKTNLQSALIVDEYGELQGLVTLTDILTAIVGGLPSVNEHEIDDIMERQDGSWLIDGSVSIEHLKTKLNIVEKFPGEKQNAYFTVGGLVIHLLGRIPSEADTIDEKGYRFEVVDMDGHRVEKVLVSKNRG